MSRITMRAVYLLSLVIFAASPVFALDLGGHDRDGTVIGLVLGYGSNNIKFNDARGTGQEISNIDSFSGGFRVGWASNDNIILSLGMYGWRNSYYSPLYLSSSAKEYHFMLEGYWFPRGEGFWIKGGIGRGTLDFYGKAALPKDDLIFNEKGWTLGTGAGYEFRVSDGAAIGFAWDYFHLPIGDYGSVTDISANSHNFSLNLHFYM